MNIFEAHKVVKKFTNQIALNKVSISVPQGSIYGLLGPNGAGKTTMLRIINQITAPDEGELFFNGKKLKSTDIYQIGYLPEERGLYKKMKVGEQALYLARLKGLSRKDALKNLIYWFDKFEIRPWWNRKVEELSKGMQQKVQFIITILHEPELLIFDEPFSGFDPINADLLKQEILNVKDKGATVIFSTHNMGSVEELCSDISLIDNGIKILEGDINKIRKNYKSNVFEICFQGSIDKVKEALNNHYKLLHHESTGDLELARIKIPDQSNNNELLSLLLPLIHIISFNEVIPSMNDIFIRVVKENTSQRTNG